MPPGAGNVRTATESADAGQRHLERRPPRFHLQAATSRLRTDRRVRLWSHISEISHTPYLTLFGWWLFPGSPCPMARSAVDFLMRTLGSCQTAGTELFMFIRVESVKSGSEFLWDITALIWHDPSIMSTSNTLRETAGIRSVWVCWNSHDATLLAMMVAKQLEWGGSQRL